MEDSPLFVNPGITIGPPKDNDITSIENLSLFAIVQSTALNKSPSSPEPPSKAITPTKFAWGATPAYVPLEPPVPAAIPAQ